MAALRSSDAPLLSRGEDAAVQQRGARKQAADRTREQRARRGRRCLGSPWKGGAFFRGKSSLASLSADSLGELYVKLAFCGEFVSSQPLRPPSQRLLLRVSASAAMVSTLYSRDAQGQQGAGHCLSAMSSR